MSCGQGGDGALAVVPRQARAHPHPGVDVPSNRYLTVSMWIYYDPSAVHAGVSPTLFHVPHTLALVYDSREALEDGTGGFDLYLRGYEGESHSGSASNDELFSFETPSADIRNRWAHICVVVDRRDGHAHRFYVDGVKMNKAATGSYGYCCGRVVNYNLLVAGADLTRWPSESYETKDRRRKNLKTGAFAGAVDDVRVYTRDLTDAEIARMASAIPGLPPNRAPQVGVEGQDRFMRKVPQPYVATAYDDGLPTGSSLTYEWEVLAGDPESVVFTSPNAATTEVLARKAGTYVLRVRVSDGERVTFGEPKTIQVDATGMIMVIR